MDTSLRGGTHRTSPTSITEIAEALRMAARNGPPGLEGTDLRCAYLLHQFANRLYEGDYSRAAAAMEVVRPELNECSARRAARTHDGMLRVEAWLARLTRPRPRGVGVFLQAVEDGWRDEFEPLLDLLPAAWGFTDDEFERVLGVRPGWIVWYRRERPQLAPEMRARLSRLRRFHEALRRVACRTEYHDAWRVVWEHASPIGERSMWQAVRDDGDAALDLLESYFIALAEANLEQWYEER